jgi:S1-C subfamily serine protease
MSVLDVVILVVAVGFAVSGFRQGFVTALLSFIGFFGAAALGAQIAQPIANRIVHQSNSRVVLAIAVVLVCALAGQVVAVWLGGELRRRITWQPAQTVDSVLGAFVSVLAVLLVAWMVATPLASSPYPKLSSAVRRSEVIKAVNTLVPSPVRELYTSLRDIVRRYDFPDVFGPFVPTQVRQVQPPDARLANSPAVRSVQPSVLKITGIAPSCSRRIEGSGFVYAPERVMTNAHVVAGVTTPRVEVDGRQRDATVVLFDPQRDVAVLHVPGLTKRALPFSRRVATTNDDAIIVGYPEDGPFFVGPARIRDRINVRGPDIYNDRVVTRQAYTLRGSVRSGNSGGPLLAPDGTVYGVIFAAAVDQDDTGFALTADEVDSDAVRGRTATGAVPTGDCA